jgi:hypothetical protein
MADYPYIKTEFLDGLIHPDKNLPIHMGTVVASTSWEGTENHEAILEVLRQGVELGGMDLLLAPEHSFNPAKAPLSSRELERLIREFERMSASGTSLIPGTFVHRAGNALYHTAYVFCGGETVMEYHKARIEHEGVLARRHGLVAMTGEVPEMPTLFGCRLAVEISADNGILIMRRNAGYDIGVLLASVARAYYKTHVRDGGYFIYAGGGHLLSVVQRVGNHSRLEPQQDLSN